MIGEGGRSSPRRERGSGRVELVVAPQPVRRLVRIGGAARAAAAMHGSISLPVGASSEAKFLRRPRDSESSRRIARAPGRRRGAAATWHLLGATGTQTRCSDLTAERYVEFSPMLFRRRTLSSSARSLDSITLRETAAARRPRCERLCLNAPQRGRSCMRSSRVRDVRAHRRVARASLSSRFAPRIAALRPRATTRRSSASSRSATAFEMRVRPPHGRRRGLTRKGRRPASTAAFRSASARLRRAAVAAAAAAAAAAALPRCCPPGDVARRAACPAPAWRSPGSRPTHAAGWLTARHRRACRASTCSSQGGLAPLLSRSAASPGGRCRGARAGGSAHGLTPFSPRAARSPARRRPLASPGVARRRSGCDGDSRTAPGAPRRFRSCPSPHPHSAPRGREMRLERRVRARDAGDDADGRGASAAILRGLVGALEGTARRVQVVVQPAVSIICARAICYRVEVEVRATLSKTDQAQRVKILPRNSGQHARRSSSPRTCP